MWKCYVTLEIVNHSIQPQTNKEPVTVRSACQQGLVEVRVVFSSFDESWNIRWAHGPWRWICSSWMPGCLTNTSSSTDASKHLLLQFPWTHPPSPFFTTKPGRPALCAPSFLHSNPSPLIWRLEPGVAYRILHQLNKENRLFTLGENEATHNEWRGMKNRWSEGESLNVNMSSV